MRILLLFSLSFLIKSVSLAQTLADYTVRLEPINIGELAGVQSYSWGKSGDEVLIVGGRLDGLHRRQPFASFDADGHNDQLIVINLKTLQIWKSKLAELEAGLYSQLKATNHCFTQNNDELMIVGGYGIDGQTNEHVTFNAAITFSVSKMIENVKSGAKVSTFAKDFQRFTDDRFAVTGGQLAYLNNAYYLVGGHKFMGRYNPNDMPTFKQTYVDGLLRFSWNSQNELNIYRSSNELEIKDSLLHKRDYNLVKVQHVQDTNYLVALSGVFRYDADLPFQNAVQVTPDLKVREFPGFRQFYNQYHCANFSVFDPLSKTTSVYLLGGISNFYDSLGVLVQNNDVPFVPTLSRLLFTPDGSVSEYLLPNRLDKLMGSGAAFFPNDDARWKDGFFNWQSTQDEEIEVGYMFGGILANQPSTFWYTEGEASSASNGFYKVILQKTDQVPVKNNYSRHFLNVQCELNSKGRYDILFAIPEWQKIDLGGNPKLKVTVKVSDKTGKIIKEKVMELPVGEFELKKYVPKKTGMYAVELTVETRPLWSWKQYLYVE